jgi:hypothetical protein
MAGKSRSLVPLLSAGRSGQIDATRDFVVTGRERHVAAARPDFLPYPQRCLRTRDYICDQPHTTTLWCNIYPCNHTLHLSRAISCLCNQLDGLAGC